MKKWIVFLLGSLIIFGCFVLEYITDKKAIIKYELQTSEYFENKPKETKYYIDDEYELNSFYSLYSNRLNIKAEILEKYDLLIEVREVTSGSKDYKLKDVKMYDYEAEFVIKEEVIKTGTDDMAFWYFVAQIPKDRFYPSYKSEWKRPSFVLSENNYNYVFEFNTQNKFVIVTDYKWETMMNDGGSHISIYYNIDLSRDVVQKVKEVYKANLGGTPVTTKEIIYTLDINYGIRRRLVDLLMYDIEAGVPSSTNYNFYTIKTLDGDIDVYDLYGEEDYEVYNEQESGGILYDATNEIQQLDKLKAKIEEVVNKIKKDDKLLEKFKKDPVKTVEGLIGIDLPDDQIEKLVDGIKAKISLDSIGDKLGGLFGKK